MFNPDAKRTRHDTQVPTKSQKSQPKYKVVSKGSFVQQDTSYMNTYQSVNEVSLSKREKKKTLTKSEIRSSFRQEETKSKLSSNAIDRKSVDRIYKRSLSKNKKEGKFNSAMNILEVKQKMNSQTHQNQGALDMGQRMIESKQRRKSKQQQQYNRIPSPPKKPYGSFLERSKMKINLASTLDQVSNLPNPKLDKSPNKSPKEFSKSSLKKKQRNGRFKSIRQSHQSSKQKVKKIIFNTTQSQMKHTTDSTPQRFMTMAGEGTCEYLDTCTENWNNNFADPQSPLINVEEERFGDDYLLDIQEYELVSSVR